MRFLSCATAFQTSRTFPRRWSTPGCTTSGGLPRRSWMRVRKRSFPSVIYPVPNASILNSPRLRHSPRSIPTRPVIVYCSAGYRGATLARRLQRFGRRDVWNLEGGIFAWANEGFEVVRMERKPMKFIPTCEFSHGSCSMIDGPTDAEFSNVGLDISWNNRHIAIYAVCDSHLPPIASLWRRSPPSSAPLGADAARDSAGTEVRDPKP